LVFRWLRDDGRLHHSLAFLSETLTPASLSDNEASVDRLCRKSSHP
jgi:hypothetical protein